MGLSRKMYPIRCFSQLPSLPKRVQLQSSGEKESFNLDKVLLVNKVSKLEVERFIHSDLSDVELEKIIRRRGIDFNALMQRHKINQDFQNKVLDCFKNFGINVRQVNRFNCTNADLNWCDAVFPIGGDGTFLFAARHVHNRNKPVVGFNSDPSRSEGFLCLPKKYSFDINSALKKLIEGKFRWMFRTRIRVNFSGNCDTCTPIELHDVNMNRYNTLGKEKTVNTWKANEIKQKLPILALNEVFMSEIFAAKVSYFEIRLNNCDKSVKIKSSGLCVCTGTGSTSWNLNINRLSRGDIYNILKLYVSKTNGEINDDFENLVTNVSNSFNERFKFGPEEQRLRYTIRDLISLRVWPHPKGLIEHRGFAETIELKSKCLDAAIIVDGGIWFPFNEGAVSCLEIHPEDALKTVVLSE